MPNFIRMSDFGFVEVPAGTPGATDISSTYVAPTDAALVEYQRVAALPDTVIVRGQPVSTAVPPGTVQAKTAAAQVLYNYIPLGLTPAHINSLFGVDIVPR